MIGNIWQFLKDQGVVLGSIAAIVAIAGGIWKFVALFAKKSEKSASILKWVVGAIGFQTIVILGALVSLVRIFAK